MTQTLTVSQSVYDWLQAQAKKRGLSSVEDLLESWKAEKSEDELRQRREVVDEIKALRQELYEKYGEQPDSVDLIREDRER
jgi:hypothetical protein